MDMICPYCNREMRKGRIWGARNLMWLPGQEKPPPFGDNGFMLRNKSPYRWSWLIDKTEIDSHYCEFCQKIITDLKPRVQ